MVARTRTRLTIFAYRSKENSRGLNGLIWFEAVQRNYKKTTFTKQSAPSDSSLGSTLINATLFRHRTTPPYPTLRLGDTVLWRQIHCGWSCRALRWWHGLPFPSDKPPHQNWQYVFWYILIHFIGLASLLSNPHHPPFVVVTAVLQCLSVRLLELSLWHKQIQKAFLNKLTERK